MYEYVARLCICVWKLQISSHFAMVHSNSGIYRSSMCTQQITENLNEKQINIAYLREFIFPNNNR